MADHVIAPVGVSEGSNQNSSQSRHRYVAGVRHQSWINDNQGTDPSRFEIWKHRSVGVAANQNFREFCQKWRQQRCCQGINETITAQNVLVALELCVEI